MLPSNVTWPVRLHKENLMSSPLCLVRFGTLALAALVLTGCATMSVNSYTERGIDFRQYRTYKFGPADTVSTGDPRLDNNPFFNQRVQADVDKELAARGFEKTSTRPDLLVHYHVSISQRIEGTQVGDTLLERNDCDTRECGPYVYEAGTLLIDFVDARTKRVVWRGWAEGSVDGLIDNQAWMEKRVDDSVRRILEKLPRRL